MREALADAALASTLPALLARWNLASNESIARRYDHEVKGLSVIKPWVGVRQDVPATATVLRARHLRPEGVVLAEGIHPFYSDLDTHAMATACVDEAVRRLVCAGARIDRISALDNFCWPDPVQGPKTPDGEHKLAQLVRCCEGLRAACEAFGVPLISGKDSMKNDAHLGGVKISIPPTLLVSAIGQIDDVSRALDLVPVAPGDASTCSARPASSSAAASSPACAASPWTASRPPIWPAPPPATWPSRPRATPACCARPTCSAAAAWPSPSRTWPWPASSASRSSWRLSSRTCPQRQPRALASRTGPVGLDTLSSRTCLNRQRTRWPAPRRCSASRPGGCC